MTSKMLATCRLNCKNIMFMSLHCPIILLIVQVSSCKWQLWTFISYQRCLSECNVSLICWLCSPSCTNFPSWSLYLVILHLMRYDNWSNPFECHTCHVGHQPFACKRILNHITMGTLGCVYLQGVQIFMTSGILEFRDFSACTNSKYQALFEWAWEWG